MTSAPRRSLVLPAGGDAALIRCSTRTDGDFHLEADPVALDHRRRAFQLGAWSQLDEVHGTAVHVVERPGECDGEVGDALVSRCRGAVLAAWVGDCAPVAFVSDDGVVAVAHAGWRGALDGVLQATVVEMRASGAEGGIRAVLGPCIQPCCYEFGAADLARVVATLGHGVLGRTSWGTDALDMPAVVTACLATVDVPVTDRLGGCTRCDAGRWFSHRRGDSGRQVLTVVKMAVG